VDLSYMRKDVYATSMDRSKWCADSKGGLPSGPRLVDLLIPKSNSHILHQG
ncbi:hypothetical protein BHM03_00061038, partial [Ensete ventricosum]